jgi:hypothetical protein
MEGLSNAHPDRRLAVDTAIFDIDYRANGEKNKVRQKPDPKWHGQGRWSGYASQA